MANKNEVQGSGAQLIDFLMKKFDRKNDAHISRDLLVAPPVISKIRHGVLPVGDSLILAIHERYKLDVSEIRKQAGKPSKFETASN